jgi:hypothetical protein
VYLHNAGMPADFGAVLWTLMRDRYRFDAAAFSREMIDGNLAGWSNIDCLGGPLAKTWDGKTKISVEQHQANFDADREDQGPTSFQGDPQRESPGITTPPIDDTSDNWGADIVYVVALDGLRILIPDHGSGTYTVVTSLPWGDEPDWDEVQNLLDGDEDDGEDEDDEELVDLDANPHETAESQVAVQKSFDFLQKGDVARAQACLLRYLADGGKQTPHVLTNLFHTITQRALPEAKVAALLDDTLETIAGDRGFLTAGLVDNVCIVLNNLGRGAESVQLVEQALAAGRPLNVNCYMGMTYGAFTSRNPTLMRRAVEHVEKVMATRPAMLAENPGVFDNTAGLYLALGDKARALEYVKLCRTHGYKDFYAMPAMPDYASIKDDPDFLALFRR